MKDHLNEKLNPEDHWKDAEKLLDDHFRKKRRGAALALLSLLLIISGGVYFMADSENAGQHHAEQVIIKKEQSTYPGNTTVIPEPGGQLTEVVSQNPSFQKPVSNNNLSVNAGKDKSSDQIVDQNEDNILNPAPHLDTVTAFESSASENHNTMEAGNARPPVMQLALLPGSNLSSTGTEASVKNIPSSLGNVELKSRYDILLYGASSYVTKETSGDFSGSYIKRRNNEEHDIILPGAGAQLSRSSGHWDFRAGLEFHILGEKVNYSPYSKGEYYYTHTEWEPFQYTITDVDTTYIFGIPVYQTKIVTVNDSLLVNVTDTLNGDHFNASIRDANGVNKYYVIEIPFDVVYQFSRGKFAYGISAGFSPGMVLRSDRYYLLNDETGIKKVHSSGDNSATLNFHTGLEFSYVVSERLRLLLKPAAKFYITELKEKSGAVNKYKTAGVNFGVMYLLK